MKKRILFIERRTADFSIETVFREIAKGLSSERFTTEFVKMPYGNNLGSIIKNLLFFQKSTAEIYHVTGHIHYIALRLPRENSALTIHDLRFLDTKKRLKRFVLKKLFLDWPVKRLRYITTISQATKDEIVFQTNCDPEKIRVIHNPLFEEFLFTESKPFDRTCPTILQIGYTKNKNIPNLVAAIEGLSCRLVVVGRIDDDLRHLLNESSVNCEIKSDLRVRQLADEYRNADIVAFCSTYEGFGLPIIEGQALGKPVVTSDQRPMNDVAGGGAILVDPYDVASIRAGILRVIEDDKLRNELIKKGFENVRRFQPDVIAAMYENFYAEILNNTDSSR